MPTFSSQNIYKVKRKDMVKSIYKHSYTKLKSISCPFQLEPDAGLKYNPKLNLIVYPYGLLEDEGKNVSLQGNIVPHKKRPPMSPSLQIKFTVTPLDDQGKDLTECSTQQSLNKNMFFVFNLLTHDQLIKELQGEYVELQLSIQIEQ